MVESKRTESDKITHAPVIILLGGKKYELKPLPIKFSSAWRKKLVQVFAGLPSGKKMMEADNVDNPEVFTASLETMFVDMPEKIIGLFVEYARDLKQEELEEIATDAEIAYGFEQAINMAFPLVNSLTMAMKNQAR